MTTGELKATTLIFALGIILLTLNIISQENYIQNIETKLNIYEQEYNNFVLEDNLRQSGIYE